MNLKRLVTAALVIGSLSSLAQGPREACPRGQRGAQCRARQAQEKAQQRRAEPVVAEKQPELTPENLLRPASERTTRLDFTGSDIKGQLNKAGGVYLYNRKELSMRTMIHEPDNFRSEITNPD